MKKEEVQKTEELTEKSHTQGQERISRRNFEVRHPRCVIQNIINGVKNRLFGVRPKGRTPNKLHMCIWGPLV
jgi:hypothetical protein